MTASIFRFFFLKPVLAVLLVMASLLLGGLGLISMPRESWPDIDIPQALVITEWPGASPELIEEEVTNPIEERLEGVRGLRRTRSTSIESASIITVEFNSDAKMDVSMQRLREAVEASRADLPNKVKRSHVEQVSVRDLPVLTFALHGHLDERALTREAKLLQKQLTRVSGVRKVTLSGHRPEVIRVRMDQDLMNARGITATEVYSALESHNQDIPWGHGEFSNRRLSLNLRGAFRDVEAIRSLPIRRSADGRAIALSDVASIERTLARETIRTAIAADQDSQFRGAVLLSIAKAPGTDSMALVSRLRQIIESRCASSDWPRGAEITTLWDESESIDEQLGTVFRNSWQSMLAVFFVLLLLLSWREAIIVSLAIPITFLATLGVLWIMGSTINELVVIGLILALGLLVDVFILFMEGIHDATSVEGLPFEMAVKKAVKTYALPALSGTITTLLVFVPMASIGGVDGKFIRVIPVTSAICLLVAFVFALLVALPLSRWFVGHQPKKLSRSDAITKKVSKFLADFLARSVVPTKKRARKWVGATVLIFVVGLGLASLLPQELYPKEDGKRVGISIELPEDTTLDESSIVAERLGKVLLDEPDIRSVARFVGTRDPFSVTSISDYIGVSSAPWIIGFSCRLVEQDDRDRLGYEISAGLRERLEAQIALIPGASLTLKPEVGGATEEDPIQINILSDNLSTLRDRSDSIRRRLEAMEGVIDVRDNLGQPSFELAFIPRRDRLAESMVDPRELSAQIRLATAFERVGQFRRPGIAHDLDIEVDTGSGARALKRGLTSSEDLDRLAIIRPQGPNVPLASLVDSRFQQADLSIPHLNRRRCVTVSARTSEGTTATEIMEALESDLRSEDGSEPQDHEIIFGGERENSAEAYNSVGKVMLVAVGLTFAILAILFGSFGRPLVVMFSVPFALIGVFFGFFMTDIAISFNALVGVIALIGVVVNDAIVMVETMSIYYEKKAFSAVEAAVRGAADRLRPILSTTITTMAGLLPLAISDAGWAPLCWAIIFGLLASTVISVIVIPCLFVLFSKSLQQAEA